MFCVLSVKQRENTFYERLFGKFVKDDYILNCVPVISGAPFYHLTATVGNRGVDFERVVKEVGRCAERLLVGENVTLPVSVKGIGKFESDLLYEKLIENTAKYVLSQLNNAFFDKENRIIKHNENVIKIGTDKNDFCFPQEYFSIKPTEIENYAFASALYELCGVFMLSESVFETIIVNGEKKSLGSVYFS